MCVSVPYESVQKSLFHPLKLDLHMLPRAHGSTFSRIKRVREPAYYRYYVAFWLAPNAFEVSYKTKHWHDL